MVFTTTNDASITISFLYSLSPFRVQFTNLLSIPIIDRLLNSYTCLIVFWLLIRLKGLVGLVETIVLIRTQVRGGIKKGVGRKCLFHQFE
jgi:hypothetical protein